LQANTRIVVVELSESSTYRPVRTRSVTSNILALQRWRNGTETWRRHSFQCEHLRLIAHEHFFFFFPRCVYVYNKEWV
jgi:hypothetical protein